jgi:hypothetical protein
MTVVRGKSSGQKPGGKRLQSSETVEDHGTAPLVAERQTQTDQIETVVAPAAIERALNIYQQLQRRDQSVIVQARKILTQHIYGMVDRGVRDEQRLTVGGLAHLKAMERDHGIRSAHGAQESSRRHEGCRMKSGLGTGGVDASSSEKPRDQLDDGDRADLDCR